MKYQYEFIKHYENLPFSIFFHENEEYPLNWHKEIEILFILKGSATIDLKDKNYFLKDKDIILINSNEIHGISNTEENTSILIMQIDPDFFEKYYSQFTEIYFECKSFYASEKNKQYEYIRDKLATIMWSFINKNEGYQLEILGESLNLVEHLINNFKKDIIIDNKIHDNQLQDRFRRILEYINKNYKKKITLTDLAQREYISIHYLSKFFKNQIGMGFSKYLNLFRLNKSINDLCNTNKSILEISLDNGFSNVKSYTKIFKENYEITPSSYRKKTLSEKNSIKKKYLKLSANSQSVLKDFLVYRKKIDTTREMELYNLEIDINEKKNEKINFEKIIYFDFVYDGLNSNWQYNLEKIQEEIKFNYIRFNGIFTKGMFFYNKRDNCYNWFNIDNLLDFFIKINLKPFIELTYTSKESALNNWHILLENFLFHCIQRYGLEEVETWKFELASDDKSYEKAIKLYTKTLNKLNKNFNTLKLGILFVPASNFEERNYLINFKNKNLSFMSVEMTHEAYFQKKELFKELLLNIKNMNLKPYFIKLDEKNYLNDTCFNASNLIYSILNNLNGVDTQVSFIDDIKNTKVFNGGSGLLTYNGLKKPIYNAYYLLNNLNGDLINKGPSHFVVRDKNKLFILLYNFCEKIDNEDKNIDYYERKKEIEKEKCKLITLKLNLDKGKYKIKTYTLNQNHGSIFDSWINMGAPEDLNVEDLEYLKSKENIMLNISVINIHDKLIIKEPLSRDEIKLIEIYRI